MSRCLVSLQEWWDLPVQRILQMSVFQLIEVCFDLLPLGKAFQKEGVLSSLLPCRHYQIIVAKEDYLREQCCYLSRLINDNKETIFH